jgi:hypothetical protein
MSLEGAAAPAVPTSGAPPPAPLGGMARSEQVESLAQMTGLSSTLAEEMLAAHTWNLDAAVHAFFGDGGDVTPAVATTGGGSSPAARVDGAGGAAALGAGDGSAAAPAPAAAAAAARAPLEPEPEGDDIDQILASARKVDPQQQQQQQRAVSSGGGSKWAGKGFSMKSPEPEPGGGDSSVGMRQRRGGGGGGAAAAAAAALRRQPPDGDGDGGGEPREEAALVPRDVQIVFWKEGFTVKDRPGNPAGAAVASAAGETRVVNGEVIPAAAAAARRGLATLRSRGAGARSPPPPLRRYGVPENEQFVADVKAAAAGQPTLPKELRHLHPPTPDTAAAGPTGRRRQRPVPVNVMFSDRRQEPCPDTTPQYHLRVISIQIEILTWLRFPYVFESWYA